MARTVKRPAECETRSPEDFALSASSVQALRRRAEAIAREKSAQLQREARSPEETQLMLHELQVHQIELEMQNEALRQAQLAIEESRDRYADFYDFAPVGYLTVTDKGFIADINFTGAALLGMERGKLLQHRFAHFVAAEDHSRWSRHFASVMGREEKLDCELALQRGDGLRSFVRLDSLRLAKDGHPAAVRIALTDISERKRVEEKISELNHDFVYFLEHTSDFIYFKDQDSRFRFCSQTLADITGHASWRDMIGKHDLEVFPKETAQIYYEEELPVFREGKPLLNKVDPFIDASGKKGWVSTNKWPLLDNEGKVVGLFGISRDITEFRQAEEALRKSEQHFRAFFERSMVGMAETSPGKGWVEVNDRLCEILGFSREELTRVTLAEITHPDDLAGLEAAFNRVLSGETDDYAIDKRFIRRDGHVVYAHVATRCIRREDGAIDYFVTLVEDISERKRAEFELLAAKNQLQAMLDALPDLLFEVGLDGRIYHYHSHRTDLLAAPPDAFLGKVFSEILPPDAAKVCLSAIRKAAEKGWSIGERYPLQLAPGERWFELSVAPKPEIAGEDRRFILLARDITERKQMEAAREEALSRLQKIASQVPGIVYQFRLRADGSSCIPFANEALREIYRISPDAVRDDAAPIFAAVHPDDLPELLASIQASARNLTPWHHEYRLKFAGEPDIWLLGKAIPQREADDSVLWHGFVTDITERKEVEDRITHLAHHDALTGLFNRLSLTERLEQALATARREHRPMAVMFLDMDRFKTINDTLGHATGDGLLVEVAHRLSEIVRNSDIVARLGGDEFVVVLTEVEGAPAAARVAEKILKSLGQSYFIGEHEVHSTPSIGLAFYPSDGDDGEALMKSADTAMYHAKSQGRNNIQFFAPDMNSFAMRRLGLEHDMRVALETGQFELHYQPQMDGSTGRFIGAEALLRWRNPKEGLVLPADFIRVAEETGLILPLGEWVLDEACRQLRDWRDQGLSNVSMAVNLSALQLRSPALLGFVAQTLEKHGLKGDDLELEITESAMMDDPKACIGKLKALRKMGVRLSINDFGTGYSSLSYLKLMPIHSLKVAQSFVRDIESDANDVVICTATIALAHNMGLSVVAEGVETEAQRDFLLGQHCDFLQGFLFSKPVGATAALAFFNGRMH